MPRRPRDTVQGFHHVWVNATGDWDYFLDEADRIVWVRLLVMTLRQMAGTVSLSARCRRTFTCF